jgi:hypothetical protein
MAPIGGDVTQDDLDRARARLQPAQSSVLQSFTHLINVSSGAGLPEEVQLLLRKLHAEEQAQADLTRLAEELKKHGANLASPAAIERHEADVLKLTEAMARYNDAIDRMAAVAKAQSDTMAAIVRNLR